MSDEVPETFTLAEAAGEFLAAKTSIAPRAAWELAEMFVTEHRETGVCEVRMQFTGCGFRPETDPQPDAPHVVEG